MSFTALLLRSRSLTVTEPVGGPSGLLLLTVIAIDTDCPGTAIDGEPDCVIVGTACAVVSEKLVSVEM